jgi:cell division protein FtsA
MDDILAVGLDIGTSKVRCVIGEPAESGEMNVVGIGEAEARGLRRGVVTTSESVLEAIEKAIGDAERQSGLQVDALTVNLSGEHLHGENKSGVVAVAGGGAGMNREITDEDVERAIESASAMSLAAGWEIADRLPQEFIVDGQDGIAEPVGMQGSRLESRVHIVTTPSAGKQNLMKVIQKAGYHVDSLVLEPLAAAESVLTDDDREYGCLLINMGAELTSMMVFNRGAVQETRVFPFGGMHFTQDIAVGLRVSISDANKIKNQHGCVAGFLLRPDERESNIEIVPVGRTETRSLAKGLLTEIMQPRAEELLEYLASTIRDRDVQLSSGIVLTGGASMSKGMVELAEQIFDAPTRLGIVRRDLVAGLIEEVEAPDWSVACGLALHSMRGQLRGGNGSREGFTSKLGKFLSRFGKKSD